MEPVRFLERVTVTGADNSIVPYDLVPITKRFPFVEWGLLIHHDSICTQDDVQHQPRFPSWRWLKAVADLKTSVSLVPIRFAGHVCGRWAQELMLGHDNFRGHDWPLFDRYQINGHGHLQSFHTQFLKDALDHMERPIIWQMDGANEDKYGDMKDRSVDIYPLFDRSHGGGVLPHEWPNATQFGSPFCGYAGGLSHHNLVIHLPRIYEACGGSPVWIDCETHVRTAGPDRFDLDKVEKFLKACEPWVIQG